MLMRLQNALGRDDLIEQMVLLWGQSTPDWESATSVKSVNLIVGYDSSPKSHTALDISLLIAHQTRIATKTHVTVQAVYVLEDNQTSHLLDVLPQKEVVNSGFSHRFSLDLPAISTSNRIYQRVLNKTYKFASAERILWQARCLAEEWQSYFKAHLRFGCLADELKKVVASEAASLLFLGCNSPQHPIIQKLKYSCPCPVLGIPHCIDNE
ncbi:universal stress protein [Chlorogloeopsis sp. ULAP01]|uniref:universal stress protein n=1 Tax=Chlorogloeopsis sp. ULAP01 TaxID=3056483 RepID=UPI0025AB054B|nr:universal stress protein [Chlorogloeopsis sp. ULAP01]MDM9380232.1 universal stress protein [Chlorogloeopsis sp. ULAP01]